MAQAQTRTPRVDESRSLCAALIGGERRALARAITLAESHRTDHRRRADALLAEALSHAGGAFRLGITGAPGVGKSTFIEAFGMYLIERGRKVAVLAVDPSSGRSGGSILGDKTRMDVLGRQAEAFVRPSPSGGMLGGVARGTRAAVLLCEAAGFDVVIVETVGVGQSEAAVADTVDMFVLVLAPGGGDDLQGLKRGVVELADLVVVNKADGELERTARRLALDYRAALSLLRPRSAAWKPEVMLASALGGTGIAEVWDAAARYRAATEGTGEIARRRAGQARAWLWREVTEGLTESLRGDSAIAGLVEDLETQVTAGEITSTAAAERVLAAYANRAT
jgi:LAO/AO transport system kinase